jgi:hypothetical protein
MMDDDESGGDCGMIGAETEVLRKNLPQYHFVHLKSLMA